MNSANTLPGMTPTRLLTPHANTGRLILAIAIALVGAITWAAYAQLDQITRGTGQVIASTHTQVVQAADGGVIQTLTVREGDHVKRGQLLASLDDTKATAMLKESAARVAALQANLARLKAEVFGGQPQFGSDLANYPEFANNQRTLFAKRQSAVREEVAAMTAALTLVKSELDMNLPLLKNGDVSRTDVLRLERQVADLTGQITNRKNKYLQDSQTELSKAEEELESVLQQRAQRQDQLDNTHLHAPVDGVIKNVRVTTLGAVLKPGEELLSIVPGGDELIVETKVRPVDIGYLKVGLPATVKFDAWDYAIHGSFPGRVSYISADTLSEESKQGEQTFYRVKVSLSTQDLLSRTGKKIQLQPGMTAQVDIKTGSHSVLRYITKPLTKTLSESMGER